MNLKARRVFEKLLDMAKFDLTLSGSPSRRMLERALEKGEPVPKKALPGALLDRLTAKERKELESLTVDDLTSSIWISLNSILNKHD
jgi:hypothetical protein